MLVTTAICVVSGGRIPQRKFQMPPRVNEWRGRGVGKGRARWRNNLLKNTKRRNYSQKDFNST